MSAPLLITRENHVETWTLNLPESRNPISDDAVIDALVEATERVGTDLDVRAVVLTGAGSAFSAGGDVKKMAAREGMFGGTPHELREGYRQGIQRIPAAMWALEVPVVAAINGPAVGAGCDLAMMCDLRVMAEGAFLAESFVKLGIIPGDGGAWWLARTLSPARAAEMILTGDRVDAATALEWGMVNQVVPADQLLDAAHALARRIAVNPPAAVRMAKRLMREAPSLSLASHLDACASLQSLAHHTADHAEAISAFLEKRPGTYTGQ